MSAGAARVLLLAGAGGTGRSTVAASLAHRIADDGPTLLVTVGQVIDPLFDGGIPRCDHVHLNPVRLLAQWWETLTASVKAARGQSDSSGSGFDPFVLEAPELTGLADAEHLLVLRAIRGHAESGDYRTVVVDGPGFDGLLELVNSPASVAAYLERVWPRHARLSAPAGGAATGPLAALLLAEPLAGLAERLAAFVADRSALELIYLLTGDGGRPERAHAELAALELLGLRPHALVLNRLPDLDDRYALDLPHPAVRWANARVAAADDAREAVAEIAEQIDRPVFEIAETPEPVRTGADAAALVWDPSPIIAGRSISIPAPEVARISGDGVDARYQWTLPLPLVDPATIALGRVEEDVVIDANGVRRRMRLPSVLRRCVVVGATYTEGELRVSFAPDPEVWPGAR